MDRRRFISLAGSLAGLAMQSSGGIALFQEAGSKSASSEILGMYIHEGWPYNHPYAARTWTLEDWRGYAGGLSKLGYNTFVIWPAIEIMPEPLTPSDRLQIAKTAEVIRLLHREFDFRVFLTLCPNLGAKDQVAEKYTFERRPLYSSLDWIDPSNAEAMRQLIRRREDLLRPLSEIDGIAIIDSDPGGYPDSTNTQFVELLEGHRKMLDRLRPGIELYYWMHVGWEAYCQFYATGRFRWGTPEESEDVLTKLKKVNPKPWGITIHTINPPPNGTDLKLAEKFGLASTALAFNYGAIEGEPSFPTTNFGTTAFDAGAARAPRGVVGNAQTHCVQIPNTFAFARGAKGQPVSAADYTKLADDLIEGKADAIVNSWQAIAGSDSRRMRSMTAELDELGRGSLKPGSLQGLLFGSPQRFLSDLAYQLRMKSAFLDFLAASKQKIDMETFRGFVDATERWQRQNGFEAPWAAIWGGGNWAGLAAALEKLRSPEIDKILDETSWMHEGKNWVITSRQSDASTPFEKVQDLLDRWDTNTPRLIAAMQKASNGPASS